RRTTRPTRPPPKPTTTARTTTRRSAPSASPSSSSAAGRCRWARPPTPKGDNARTAEEAGRGEEQRLAADAGAVRERVRDRRGPRAVRPDERPARRDREGRGTPRRRDR